MKEFCKNDDNYNYNLCWDCDIKKCLSPDCQWEKFKNVTNPKYTDKCNIQYLGVSVLDAINQSSKMACEESTKNLIKGMKYDNKY